MKSLVRIPALSASLIFPLHSSALELAVGVELSNHYINIYDAKDSHTTVAQMVSDFSLNPTLSIVSDAYYFGEESHYGVQLQLRWSRLKLDKQGELYDDPTNLDSISDLGTSISGYNVSAVPAFIYHFNRHHPDEWNTKIGGGLGVGYLYAKGNYKVTRESQPDFSEVKEVKISEVGVSSNVFIELNKGNHSFSLNAYYPVLEVNPALDEMTLQLSYLYHFELSDIF